MANYTIPYFIKEVTKTTNKSIDEKGIFNTLAPVGGSTSVKAATLNNLLSGYTQQVVNGTHGFSSYGATPRTRLLKALKVRQKTGSVFGNQ